MAVKSISKSQTIEKEVDLSIQLFSVTSYVSLSIAVLMAGTGGNLRPGSSSVEPTLKLFVGGLPWSVTSSSLRQAFEPFGEVSEARVITEKEEPNKSRGFG